MVKLAMNTFSCHRRQEELRPGCSTWRLGTEDYQDAIFPSNERIKELFDTHLPKTDGLVVIRVYNNCITIEIPKGTTPMKRKPFLEALEKEMRRSP